MVSRVDWWFSYTDATTKILLKDGYPKDRISTLNNAIDNETFIRDMESVDDDMRAKILRLIDADELSVIALFCGSLYLDKRLHYMIEAADIVSKHINNFRLIIIGDGPDSNQIDCATQSRPWMKWVGTQTGVNKASYFRIADFIFNPGAVGLHILDSFCSGVPMITCADAKHGPEISYIKHGENALMVDGGPSSYANEIIDLVSNPTRLRLLQQGALKSAEKYTLVGMVNNFVEGIEQCLETPKNYKSYKSKQLN